MTYGCLSYKIYFTCLRLLLCLMVLTGLKKKVTPPDLVHSTNLSISFLKSVYFKVLVNSSHLRWFPNFFLNMVRKCLRRLFYFSGIRLDFPSFVKGWVRYYSHNGTIVLVYVCSVPFFFCDVRLYKILTSRSCFTIVWFMSS